MKLRELIAENIESDAAEFARWWIECGVHSLYTNGAEFVEADKFLKHAVLGFSITLTLDPEKVSSPVALWLPKKLTTRKMVAAVCGRSSAENQMARLASMDEWGSGFDSITGLELHDAVLDKIGTVANFKALKGLSFLYVDLKNPALLGLLKSPVAKDLTLTCTSLEAVGSRQKLNQALVIVKKYLKSGDIAECAEELIDNDYSECAKL